LLFDDQRPGDCVRNSRHHALLRKCGDLRDTTPCIPEAAADIWLYSAVDMNATPLVEGLAARISPRCSVSDLPPRRTSLFAGTKKVSDGTRTRGRRDHNPAKGGALSPDSALQRRLSRRQLCSLALTLDPVWDPVGAGQHPSSRYLTTADQRRHGQFCQAFADSARSAITGSSQSGTRPLVECRARASPTRAPGARGHRLGPSSPADPPDLGRDPLTALPHAHGLLHLPRARPRVRLVPGESFDGAADGAVVLGGLKGNRGDRNIRSRSASRRRVARCLSGAGPSACPVCQRLAGPPRSLTLLRPWRRASQSIRGSRWNSNHTRVVAA
jgi:hypothetical protein